jgi:hypothetical protein
VTERAWAVGRGSERAWWTCVVDVRVDVGGRRVCGVEVRACGVEVRVWEVGRGSGRGWAVRERACGW